MDRDSTREFDALLIHRVLKSTLSRVIKHVSDEAKSISTLFRADDLREMEEAMSSINAALPLPAPEVLSTHYQLAYDIQEVAYNIEVLLDEASTQRLERTVGVGSKNHLLAGISSLLSPSFTPDIDPKGMIARLSSLKQKFIKVYGEQPNKVPPTSFIKSKTRAVVKESSSHNQQQLVGLEEIIFGREEEKERLIQLILAPSTTLQHPAVIQVTGPGGIGKTTLVKLVCNYSRVSSSFDMVLWASFASGLTFNFFESHVPESSFHHQEQYTESLSHRLTDFLHGRKCLLVLDDINGGYWNRREEELNKALEILKAGSTGSTIILMTWRFIKIERFTESFKLDDLPEEECWSLFKRYAAFDEDSEQAASLKDLGRSIVRKCYGNPLAVKSMAISLRNKEDKHYWEHISTSFDPEHISTSWRGSVENAWPGLYLSIEQASFEVMECYASFSIVARGSYASRDQLIYFWMALGLLPSTQEHEDLIDVGNRFCNELLSINLLKFCQTDYLSPVCYSAQILMENIVRGYLGSYRHLNSTGYGVSTEIFFMPSRTAERVRPLIFRDIREDVRDLFLKGRISKFTHLRVLFVEHSEFEELPETIGKLKFLRYLSLAGNDRLQTLPHSICKLLNLQTLDLSGCVQLKELPRNMDRLVSLRHLLLSMKLTVIPEEAFKSWTSLHHLKICHCPHLESLEVGMSNLTALRALGIHDCPSIASLPDYLNCLNNLKELSIRNCQNLDLTGWRGLHGLKSLKSLRIQGLPKLLELPDGLQFGGYLLQHLFISNCENLRILPESLQHCISLEEMIIENCPNLYALPHCTPALRNLSVLKIHSCPKLVERYQIATGYGWRLKSHIPEVNTNKASSSLQEQPGAQNFSPTECQSDPSLPEIRPASATSPTKISLFPEKEHPTKHYSVQSLSEHDLFPPNTDAAEHPQPAPIEHSHQPAFIPLSQYPTSTYDSSLVNQGADYNEQQLGKQILFLFGEGYKFEKQMLIQLWMALELFTDEVVGANFFEKLVSEEYILCSSNYLYKVNMGKLNSELDMITERQKYVILNNGSQNEVASTGILHVSVVCDEIDESIFRTLGRFNGLRVLLFLPNYGSRLQEAPRDIFLCYESLVALDLSGSHIKELPSSAEKMIHLRFLDLSWTFIELLPERIGHFKMLQTLKLKGCSCLHRLPKELKVLTELRHLDLDVLGQLASFPEGIGALVNLRTLSAFPVGKEEGLKISELKFLDNLTNEFCIAKLENVQSREEAKEASLTAKRGIKKLKLRWSGHQFQEPKNEDEMILNNLCPYSELEEIQILCYPGTRFPGWITDVSFHKLVSITLFRCVHVSVLPLLEKLPELVSLELISLNSVTDVNFKGEVGEVAFPKLQKLGVDEMLTLESWAAAQEGDYPCLINVSIKDCPKLSELPSLPYLPSIENLEVSGCTEFAFVSEKKLSPSLQQLIVEDCPLITERCSEQGGQDWHKIQDVLRIWIDQVAIKINEDIVEEDSDDDDNDDDDWSEIEGIPYVEINATKIQTESYSHDQTNNKDEVSRNEHPHTLAKLVKENKISQPGQPSGDRPPPRRELQGPRPAPLKVRKSSHKFRKPPVAPQAASAAPQPPPPSNPPPPRPPVIIYAVSPKVIHTSPSSFMNLVQRLTGPDPGPSATTATSAFSGAAGPSSMLSPAARYASIEKTKIPLQDNFINSSAASSFMEGINTSGYEYLLDTRPGGFTHGHSVLSPGPAGLIRPVHPAFFSPLSDPISPLISMYHQHQQDHLNTLQQLQHLGGGGGEGGGWSGGYNILPSP